MHNRWSVSNQRLNPQKLKASLARSMVQLKPRHASAAEIFFRHGIPPRRRTFWPSEATLRVITCGIAERL
jgi:hypothetical protein